MNGKHAKAVGIVPQQRLGSLHLFADRGHLDDIELVMGGKGSVQEDVIVAVDVATMNAMCLNVVITVVCCCGCVGGGQAGRWQASVEPVKR